MDPKEKIHRLSNINRRFIKQLDQYFETLEDYKGDHLETTDMIERYEEDLLSLKIFILASYYEIHTTTLALFENKESSKEIKNLHTFNNFIGNSMEKEFSMYLDNLKNSSKEYIKWLSSLKVKTADKVKE